MGRRGVSTGARGLAKWMDLLARVLAAQLLSACGSDPVSMRGDVSLDGAVDAPTIPADGGVPDATTEVDGAVVPAAPIGDVVYEPGEIHSPIDESIVQRWQGIIGNAPSSKSNVFAKVGDSITASEAYFMGCFVSQSRSLGSHEALAATLDYFAAGDAAGTDPFQRDSVTAIGGWTALKAISGDPSPIEREVTAIDPRFAIVMYGTNDVGLADNLFNYVDQMDTLLDAISGRGVLPILSTIPPRVDSAGPNGRVAIYNAMIRALAQTRGFPLIDYFSAMVPLPSQGLAGDGVHPNAFADGAVRPCDLRDAALQKGYNRRNFVSLQALDRVKRALIDNESFSETTRRSLSGGSGKAADPFVIRGLPFAHGHTTVGGQSQLDKYDGCSADQDESGPEIVYKLEVDRAMDLQVYLADPGNIDVDIHLLRDMPTTPACEARAHQLLTYTVDPGTWYIVVDSFVVGASDVRSGEYLLVVTDAL